MKEKLDKEYRSIDGLGFQESESKEMILEGYAIVFNTPTLIGDEERGYYEVIDNHALDEADIKDVPFKVNHNDINLILARTRNGSLQLSIDDKGLFFRAKLQDNVQSHCEIYNMVKTELLDKMSFAFTVKEHELVRSGKIPTRIIKKIDKLFDISVVTVPAYDATTVQARSIEAVETALTSLENEERQSLEKEKAEQEAKQALELEKLKIKIRLGIN